MLYLIFDRDFFLKVDRFIISIFLGEFFLFCFLNLLEGLDGI